MVSKLVNIEAYLNPYITPIVPYPELPTPIELNTWGIDFPIKVSGKFKYTFYYLNFIISVAVGRVNKEQYFAFRAVLKGTGGTVILNPLPDNRSLFFY